MGCGSSTSTAATRQPMSVGVVPDNGHKNGTTPTTATATTLTGSGKSSAKPNGGLPSVAPIAPLTTTIASPTEVKSVRSLTTSGGKGGTTTVVVAVAAAPERKTNTDRTGPSNLWKLGEERSPWGIAYYEGLIYVTDMVGHTITAYRRDDGREVRSWGVEGDNDGEMNQPSGIAFSRDGLCYVVDTGNARIQAFTPEGRFMRKWGKQGDAPGEFGLDFRACNITIDPNANTMYIPHVSRGIICVYECTTGKLLTRISMDGTPDGITFHEPIGVCIVPHAFAAGVNHDSNPPPSKANAAIAPLPSVSEAAVVTPHNSSGTGVGADVTLLVTDRSNRIFAIYLRGGAMGPESQRKVRAYGKDATEGVMDDDIIEDGGEVDYGAYDGKDYEDSSAGQPRTVAFRPSSGAVNSKRGSMAAGVASKRAGSAAVASKRGSRLHTGGMASKRGSYGGGPGLGGGHHHSGLHSKRGTSTNGMPFLSPTADLSQDELLDFPTGICVAPLTSAQTAAIADGRDVPPATVYVCDTYRARICNFTAGAWPPKYVGATPWNPINEDEPAERYGMVLCTNPLQLYVTDYGAHSIGIFDVD